MGKSKPFVLLVIIIGLFVFAVATFLGQRERQQRLEQMKLRIDILEKQLRELQQNQKLSSFGGLPHCFSKETIGSLGELTGQKRESGGLFPFSREPGHYQKRLRLLPVVRCFPHGQSLGRDAPHADRLTGSGRAAFDVMR